MERITYHRKPLGNNRFQWKQQDFVLSTFTCAALDMEKSIQNWKEVGVNLVELGFASHEKAWQAVELCEKYGVDLLFQDLSQMGGMSNLFMDRPVSDDTIRSIATNLKDKKHTIGYYVWDEPSSDDMFAEARRQSDIFHQYDPESLLFTVFVPSYNGWGTWETGTYPELFEEYLQRLDPPVLSFDHYPIGDYFKLYPEHVYDDEKQLDDSPIWCDLGLARKLSKKYNLPFWFYYQACKLYECTHKFVFPMIRMMMHAAAIYGAKGLQLFAVSYDKREEYFEKEGYLSGEQVITYDGDKGPCFEEQKTLHREFHKLGNTLMALHSELVYHSSDVKPFGIHAAYYDELTDSIHHSTVLSGPLPRRTSVGELCDDYGNRYLLILNRDFYENLDATLPLKESFNLYSVSKQDGEQYLTKECVQEINVHLQPGDAVLIRVQSAKDTPNLIKYVK